MRSTSLAFSLALLALSTPALHAQVSPSADYELRFESTWSDTTHSEPLPPFAHYSPLVGALHDDTVDFWQPGALASPGIEVMAETGGTGTLIAEIDTAILAGSADVSLVGPGILTPATGTLEFTANLAHPQLTMVTMIAPSPDWFVGVDSHRPPSEDGRLGRHAWSFDAATLWDAGTDSGPAFTSPNQDTSPADPIALLTNGPFFGTTPLGRFVITRKSIVTFCDAKVNSLGCLPSIGSTGTPSASSAAPFEITATNVRNQQYGMLFYGHEPFEQPFNGGTLCAMTPVKRTFPIFSDGNAGPADCSGTYSFDMNAWIQGGSDAALTPGTRVVAQFWSRDPGGATPTGLTNALDFTIEP